MNMIQKHFQLVQDLTIKGNKIVREVAVSLGNSPSTNEEVKRFWQVFISKETPSNSTSYFAAKNLAEAA